MKLVTTTEDYARYLSSDIERIKKLHAAGFRYVDLSMYSWKLNSVYMNDGWQEAVNDLKTENFFQKLLTNHILCSKLFHW